MRHERSSVGWNRFDRGSPPPAEATRCHADGAGGNGVCTGSRAAEGAPRGTPRLSLPARV
jgi:hypothetical protein